MRLWSGSFSFSPDDAKILAASEKVKQTALRRVSQVQNE